MQDVNLVLADRYQARERLGSGAGAGVEEYLGRDLRLARPVVIQVIRGAGKDGFAPQARLMASLDHPAVASVYDWGQQEGLAYLIREYVPGQNLRRLLTERGVLPVTQAAGIGAEVAAALAAAHRIGLAHGSLDAADVILGEQRVTVVGFGAAWMREAAGIAEGSAAGARPPRTGVANPHAQDDLRALGAMLHQMITGAPLEQWPPVTSMGRAGRSGRPGPADALLRVIGRLVAPPPGGRYRAAEAVRADLLHLTHAQQAVAPYPAPSAVPATPGPEATTEPVRVPPDAPPNWVSAGGDELEGHEGTGRRRHWAGIWAGVILGLVLLGGAVGGALVLARDPGQRATIQPPDDSGPSSLTTGRTTRLPDVVGLDTQTATSKLELAGFVANISRQPSDQTPGVVIRERPAAGDQPPRDAIVFLTVSSGPGGSPAPGGPGGATAPGDAPAPGVPPATRSPGPPPKTTAAQASP
jgi:eukaryotic-like serine/threonine-protein kinase